MIGQWAKGPPPQQDETLYGKAAKQYVDDIERDQRLPKDAQEIWDLTNQEDTEGVAGKLGNRRTMDKRFGVGNRRPLVRYLIWQAGKWRSIATGSGREPMPLQW